MQAAHDPCSCEIAGQSIEEAWLFNHLNGKAWYFQTEDALARYDVGAVACAGDAIGWVADNLYANVCEILDSLDTGATEHALDVANNCLYRSPRFHRRR